MEASRLDEALRRTPALPARLFTEGERGGAPVARVADPRAGVAFVVAEK